MSVNMRDPEIWSKDKGLCWERLMLLGMLSKLCITYRSQPILLLFGQRPLIYALY